MDRGYGRPMKPFFIKIPNFWAWADKLPVEQKIPKILLFIFFQTQKPIVECVKFTYLQSTTYDVGPQRVNINQQFLHIYAFLFLNFQTISLEKLFEIASSWIFKCEFIAILSPL